MKNEWNKNDKMQVVFYADHANYKNKRFTFQVASEDKATELVARFIANGNTVRAVYLTQYWVMLSGAKQIISNYQLDSEVLKEWNLMYK